MDLIKALEGNQHGLRDIEDACVRCMRAVLSTKWTLVHLRTTGMSKAGAKSKPSKCGEKEGSKLGIYLMES